VQRPLWRARSRTDRVRAVLGRAWLIELRSVRLRVRCVARWLWCRACCCGMEDGNLEEQLDLSGDERLLTLYLRGLCVTEAPSDPRFGMTAEESGRRGDAQEVHAQWAAAELWKTLCSDCPVWRTCLDYAVDTHQTGIWSGTSDGQRALIRGRRQAASFG
jgi:hypothetical protein